MVNRLTLIQVRLAMAPAVQAKLRCCIRIVSESQYRVEQLGGITCVYNDATVRGSDFRCRNPAKVGSSDNWAASVEIRREFARHCHFGYTGFLVDQKYIRGAQSKAKVLIIQRINKGELCAATAGYLERFPLAPCTHEDEMNWGVRFLREPSRIHDVL
jgi:hypothetical protein